MFDEWQRLDDAPELLALLAHYVERGAADREAWLDRLMELDGITSRELVQRHGELLAYGWIEQNTGMTPVHKAGVVAACYRITSAGVRALKQARTGRDVDEIREARAA